MILAFNNNLGEVIYLAATVGVDTVVGVHRKHLVGVNSDAEETRVCVDEELGVTRFQYIQNRGLVEVGQVSHVFALNNISLSSNKIC